MDIPNSGICRSRWSSDVPLTAFPNPRTIFCTAEPSGVAENAGEAVKGDMQEVERSIILEIFGVCAMQNGSQGATKSSPLHDRCQTQFYIGCPWTQRLLKELKSPYLARSQDSHPRSMFRTCMKGRSLWIFFNQFEHPPSFIPNIFHSGVDLLVGNICSFHCCFSCIRAHSRPSRCAAQGSHGQMKDGGRI